MVLDFVERRVAAPVKLADWGEVEEGQTVVCACCGWSGRLGECVRSATDDARVYSCSQCDMVLVARAVPRVISFRGIAAARAWREERRVANL